MKKRIIYLLLLVTALLALSACAKQEASESLYFLEDGAIYKRLGTLRSEQVLLAAGQYAQGSGFSVEGVSFSPIKGPEGNIEFLLYVQKKTAPCPLEEAAAQKVVEDAHAAL